jgi:hypothetical protein
MSTENPEEIRTPADAYHLWLKEVGIENRGILQETIDRHMNDYVMTNGTVQEGFQHILERTKERLPKAPPPPPEPGPMENGYRYQEGPKGEKHGLSDALVRRRAQRRGR